METSQLNSSVVRTVASAYRANGMSKNALVGLAVLALVSCNGEPLPPVRPIHPEPILVAGWDIPDAQGLRSALVRAHLAEDTGGSLKVAYCVQFCEYDLAKARCNLYDPPESFFAPFVADHLPIYPWYACPRLGRPYLTMRMVVGPFWRRLGEKDLIAEVGVSPPGALPEGSAEYSAAWGVGGWNVSFLTPPPP
jgi:hypothetical protein